MNNLHRELAPVSAAAWVDLEAEARRTFTAHVAIRRLVDIPAAGGAELAAVPTGHSDPVDALSGGVHARLRRSKPLVELRAPFTVSRRQVDDVERGARDADWQPVKDAARRIAFAEDRTVFEGLPPAGIEGLRNSSTHTALELPADPRDYPEAVGKGVSALRLAGVGGPYALALSADAYEAVSETSDHGHPVREHIARMLGGDIVWAPAVTGAFLMSTRGGDFTLRLGQDLSIGYLSHDTEEIHLYFQETFTFLVHTAEATVHLASR
ncbi:MULTISPECIES: family 1 encapsulin nanocompartment shell protein [unclassified Streptomyces]|uniref:family 1 encapsulin nanocompartment shell protein n=1 Tax=unclassified Streptomyces TaxID=2593676 RepID=UPI0004C99C66|nr:MULTISPECIES: family 1 encapsulin nanocompartment shell protein [unclassified Streptomyces]KOV71351.1 bacteriocin [Streptomyces sp. NRRL WC-3723]